MRPLQLQVMLGPGTGDGGEGTGDGGRELGTGRSGTGDGDQELGMGAGNWEWGGQELGMGMVRWAALGAGRVSALQEAETAPIKRHASAFPDPTLAWLPQCGVCHSASAHRRGRRAGVRHGAQRRRVNVHRPCSWTPCAGSSLRCKIWDKQGS